VSATDPGRPFVRPLRKDDGRAAALLVASVYAELGSKPAMSVEATERLFATPWLENGGGLVLERDREMGGYGFARPTRWKGMDCVQLGLFLRQGYRSREAHRVLTEPLLRLADELGARQNLSCITVHYRSTDDLHPPVMLDMGFREHAASMMGYRHDLSYVPDVPLPTGFMVRSAALPDEKTTLLALSARSFDDRERQGEPLHETYLDFLIAKSDFSPEQVLIAEKEGEPAAYAISDGNAHEEGRLCHIAEVGVLPAIRGQGMGSALVSRSLSWAKSVSARAAITSTFSTNRAAVMYWRMGFRPDPLRTFRFFIRDLKPVCPSSD
jgi:GNAT superfamily N-acetyltransferase